MNRSTNRRHRPAPRPLARKLSHLALAGAMLAAGPTRADFPGQLDPDFGGPASGGWVVIGTTDEEERARDIAFDSQGRILVAWIDIAPGQSAWAILKRLLPDGTPDLDFGVLGHYAMEHHASELSGAYLAVLGNTIFLGATVQRLGGETAFYIDKIDSFGNRLASEMVDFDLGGGHHDYLTDLAVAPGRLVAVGRAEYSNDADYDYAIAGLDPATLTLDPSFSGDGKVTVHFDLGGDDYDEPLSVEFDAGRIVVAGTSEADNGTWLASIARLDTAGGLDAGFSNDGRAVFAYTPVAGTSASFNEIWDVVVDPSGALWAAAEVIDPLNPNATHDAALLRILGNGVEDSSWGVAGWTLYDFPYPSAGWAHDSPRSLLRDAEGRFLLTVDSTSPTAWTDDVVSVARLDPNGLFDPTYGAGVGFVQHWLPSNGTHLHGAALDAQDRVLACGSLLPSGATTRDAFVIRLSSDVTFRDGFESGSTAAWSSTTP